MIAALFVQKDGIYFGLPDVDPWDEKRDARRYAGPWPVVAHPPCSRWCKLAPVNQARYGHRIGDDDGCFESALSAVQIYGGVLEHPAGSLAWDAFNLSKPRGHGWTKKFGDIGWVCEVSQRVYGHKAQKKTWLYAVTRHPPSLDWRQPRGEAMVSYMTNHGGSLPRLSKKEAQRTPLEFRDVLLAIARDCE